MVAQRGQVYVGGAEFGGAWRGEEKRYLRGEGEDGNVAWGGICLDRFQSEKRGGSEGLGGKSGAARQESLGKTGCCLQPG